MALPSLLKTPDEYLATMIDRIAMRGSRLTDFNDGSIARSTFEALAAALSQQSAVADQHRKDSYLSTATGDALTLKALDNGVVRKAAVQATGNVRITRADTTAAVTIPAGWGPLATVPTPGGATVTYTTLADAVLGIGVGFVDVQARAVDGGVAGNNAQGPTAETTLLPINPVPGFDTASDFKARGPFVGGVDEETDDQLRTRVPITVQGRTKGKRASFLAAALNVPGVTSAQVRQAGESKIGGTVSAGQVQVYYEGLATLLPAVQFACDDAAVLDQNVTVTTAVEVEVFTDATAYILPGVAGQPVRTAMQLVLAKQVSDCGVGDIWRVSKAIGALHTLPDVQSLVIPVVNFRKSTDASGTTGDIDPGVGKVLVAPDVAAAFGVGTTVLS